MTSSLPWGWILHLDLDSFYASVEQRDKPSLKGRALVVGGGGDRGVVATASYEARRFGVGSAMSTSQARSLCPGLLVLPPRFAAYREASQAVMGIVREHVPLVETISLDEAYLDLRSARGETLAESLGGDPVRIARSIRQRVRDEVGLVASIGAGRTKLVAKLASDAAKPDGLLVVTPERERAFLDPMPVERMWGVGPATHERLRKLRIKTIGDLASADDLLLEHVLGKTNGRGLRLLARGEDTRAVEGTRDAKSISHEETFDRDITSRITLRGEVSRISRQVAQRAEKSNSAGRTITLRVRFEDFTTISRSRTLRAFTDSATEIARGALGLLDDVDVSPGVRLIGVSLSGLGGAAQAALDLGDAPETLPLLAAQDPSEAPKALRVGDHVTHPHYGPGWIESIDGYYTALRLEGRGTAPGRVRTFDTRLVTLQLQ